MRVTYDPYSDDDTDGDGDPHTVHTIDLVARDQVVLPEIEDLIRALGHCTDTVCSSEEREFRLRLASRELGGGLASLAAIFDGGRMRPPVA